MDVPAHRLTPPTHDPGQDQSLGLHEKPFENSRSRTRADAIQRQPDATCAPAMQDMKASAIDSTWQPCDIAPVASVGALDQIRRPAGDEVFDVVHQLIGKRLLRLLGSPCHMRRENHVVA